MFATLSPTWPAPYKSRRGAGRSTSRNTVTSPPHFIPSSSGIAPPGGIGSAASPAVVRAYLRSQEPESPSRSWTASWITRASRGPPPTLPLIAPSPRLQARLDRSGGGVRLRRDGNGPRHRRRDQPALLRSGLPRAAEEALSRGQAQHPGDHPEHLHAHPRSGSGGGRVCAEGGEAAARFRRVGGRRTRSGRAVLPRLGRIATVRRSGGHRASARGSARAPAHHRERGGLLARG